ncbi:FAD:protein FMN transferase [Paracoccus sp. Z118]|uniref:FAD:protein FMN transferase n=1 Tax=Paracoccus sp. Z118 TaxID=2851017 RepID=UPI001C2C11D6|nr:FAD:protein FMN transferase [Paracoccus sp. Z118]MBV0893040.1 FAD:protein FMN transferase [Paracoccus sp. Z118]
MPDTPIRLSRRTLLAAAPALLAAPALARSAGPSETLQGAAFGTGWRVTLPVDAPRPPVARIAALLAEVDAQMSPWRADSEIGRFNGGLREMPVATDTAAVTRAALRLAEASGGAFDPTVGPLVSRWGFGPIAGESRREGWRGIEAGDRGIGKADAGLTLDLCGIAKGYALDRLAALLLDAGTRDVLVDLGGELAAHGRHPSGRDWHVAVEDPREGATGAAEILRLGGRAVATSGDKVNGYTLAGRRYGHIIDPPAAEPVAGALASVSVVADSGMEADGWATALFAAGEGRGPALAEARGIAALFLFRDGDGLRRHMTAALAAHLA